MNYPVKCKNVIDVTKPPYNADNTGRTDCTEALRRVLDDLLLREIQGIEQGKQDLLSYGEAPVYCGFENRFVKNDYYPQGNLNVIFPEFVPSSRIIYFPAGTYLVSDTVTYTHKNLQNIHEGKPFAEICRGIHLMGESMDSVTIRLADHSKGFEVGTQKPVVSLNNREGFLEKETTNVAQLNTIEDMTIDCGSGNSGAVGIRFCSNNSGRLEHLRLMCETGYVGIQYAHGSEASVTKIQISGFDYGMCSGECVLTVNEIDCSGCKKSAILAGGGRMTCHRVECGAIPRFEFFEGFRTSGDYYVTDSESKIASGELFGNKLYIEEETPVERMIPENRRSKNAADWVCVDDFGAVGDGVTDCTRAIQKAMNSGKPIVLFGEGHYLINGLIRIPASVKTVDFMFCDLFSGGRLIGGEVEAAFDICEESDEILFLENLYTFEQFYGHMHFVRQSAKRTVVLSDLHIQTAAMYYNVPSAEGSKLYLDNVACTVGTYSCDTIIGRQDHVPAYAHMIPFAFYGLTVYGRQVNPERGDVELLNDHSKVMIDMYKVEGPGTAVKTVNGGVTYINTGTCGIGFVHATNALWETEESKTRLCGIRLGAMNARNLYKLVVRQVIHGTVLQAYWEDVEELNKFTARINRYDSENYDPFWHNLYIE